MSDVKCFFQLVNASSGNRTQAVGMSRYEFVKRLKMLYPSDSDMDGAFVLVLVDDCQSQWNFSTAPMMTVRSFISNFDQEVDFHV